MYYLIIARDTLNSLPLRRQARAAHLARLDELRDQGRLLTAGPMPAIDSEDPGEAGFSGSTIIAEFPSLDAAKQWAETDPFRAAGVYSNITVQPYKRIY